MANITKTPTKRENFTALLNLEEVKANPVLVKFINHELELLDKKNTSDKKPTATQIANEALMTTILDYMEVNVGYTVTDIIKGVDECSELSNQKVSALMRALKDKGAVTKTEGKKTLFYKVED
jgi:hypothetical protein